ncbi:MAG: hypothetical protein KDG57_11200, partial [Rhodoferax sp.]|nr:hypothetical protein [Rhodoferax sp.]
ALRAERLNTLGDAVASLQGYEAALCELGLEEATQAASRWRDLPRALWRVWRASDWPQEPAARVAFERVLARALMMYTQQLSFTSSMQRSVRANLMASVHAACAGGAPERQGVRVMSAYGALTMGQARSAAWLLPARRKPAGEPLFDAFAAEGECVTRIALGRWDGVAERLDALHQRMVALGDHRHAMECHSLLAKLLFYRGDLVRAAERFAASTELSLARPGGAWRAWGPFGQAEVAMCTGGVPASDLRRWVDLGSHWMTELVNVDAAYTLRRHGLMARLAWQAGDVAGSREAVLGGVAAAARITHCGFWAQEGFAGIGQVLLALRQREAQAGGAVTPWDKAWQAYARRLHAHGRSFPAGWAMVWRLCGEAAAVQGRPELARRLLGKALRLAERQGLRVELARCFDAQAVLDADAGHDWAARAQRLRREMTAGIPASAHGPGVC